VKGHTITFPNSMLFYIIQYYSCKDTIIYPGSVCDHLSRVSLRLFIQVLSVIIYPGSVCDHLSWFLAWSFILVFGMIIYPGLLDKSRWISNNKLQFPIWWV